MRSAIRPCALLAIGALAGCSGGSPGSPQARPDPTNALATGRLVLAIPARATDARSRKPLFLSPSAASVSISVTGIATPVVANISGAASACTASADGARTCSIPLQAPLGTDTFVAKLYAGANATGTVLGTGSVLQQIATTAAFTLTIAVSGNPASVALSAAQTTFVAGTKATIALIVTVKDAGGNVIAGDYTSPIALTNSDTSGTFTVTPATVATSDTPVTLVYSGGDAATTATISASSAGVSSTSVSAQTLIVSITSGASPGPGSSARPGVTATPTAGPSSGASPSPSPAAPGGPEASPTPTAVATAFTGPYLYVAEIGSNALTVTPENANGNVAPVASISGGKTMLDQPYGVALDTSGVAYVSNYAGGTIVSFAEGADGNATPQTAITGLNGPLGVAVDCAGNLIESNFSAESIDVFAPGATGAASPTTIISGGNTGLSQPYGLTLDTAGNLYVVNNASQFGGVDSVTVYPPSTDGNVAPVRTISGSSTGMDGAVFDAVDSSGDIFVSNSYANTVTEYGPNAKGNVAPIATITGLTSPTGLALDAHQNLYVVSDKNDSIEVFAPGANGAATPLQTISGSATGFDGADAIAIGPETFAAPDARAVRRPPGRFEASACGAGHRFAR